MVYTSRNVKIPRLHVNLGFFVLFSQPARAIISTLAERAATRPFAVRAWIIPPTHYLRENSCSMNFRLPDAPGNNDLESFPVFTFGHQGSGFGGGHLLM